MQSRDRRALQGRLPEGGMEGGRRGGRGGGRGARGGTRDQYPGERTDDGSAQRSRALEEVMGALAEVGSQEGRGRREGRGGGNRREEGRRGGRGPEQPPGIGHGGGGGGWGGMSGRGRERGEGGHQYGGREGWQAHYANQGSREGQGQRSGGQGLKDIHGPRGGQGFKGLDPEARSWTPGLREQNQDPRDGGQRPRLAGRGSREPQRFRGRDEGYRNGGQERSQEGERPREAKVAEGRPEEQGELGSDLTERLSTALTRGTAECLVCLERVRQTAPTWDCQRCFQVFHLPCIKRWAKSAVAPTGGWRCPGCQAITDAQPADYRCFCRKVKNPEWGRNEGLVPHTCGAMCGRTKGCGVHHCTELCHPGRCPPCTATVLAKVTYSLDL